MRVAAVSAHFGRDVEPCLAKIEAITADARAQGVELLVFPDATIGGYLGGFGAVQDSGLPPAFPADDDVFTRLAAAAGPTVACLAYRETEAGRFYNSAVCLGGDGVLGRHRKVHQPVGEIAAYSAGDASTAFDTPVGPKGMLIDYDKTFPEAARTPSGGLLVRGAA